MEQGKRRAIIAAGALVLVLAAAIVTYNALAPRQMESASGAAVSGQTNEPKEQAPVLADYDATVYTSEGKPISLVEIADGKPLVINYWATWCGYCVQEMPDYQQLHHVYGDRVSFAFIDANHSKNETAEKAKAWLAENDYTDLPAYFDTDAQAGAIFGIRSYPTTIVVAADGEIVSAAAGMIDAGRMDALLSSLVE